MKRSNRTNKTTQGSEGRSSLKNGLTGPTLLEMTRILKVVLVVATLALFACGSWFLLRPGRRFDPSLWNNSATLPPSAFGWPTTLLTTKN